MQFILLSCCFSEVLTKESLGTKMVISFICVTSSSLDKSSQTYCHSILRKSQIQYFTVRVCCPRYFFVHFCFYWIYYKVDRDHYQRKRRLKDKQRGNEVPQKLLKNISKVIKNLLPSVPVLKSKPLI